MRQIRVRRLSAVRYFTASLTLSVAALVANPVGHAMRFDGEMDFTPLGLQPDRAYFSQLPWENIDLVNGNLLLRIPVLSLPGDAGMNLRLEWAYNRADWGIWRFGIAGVPVFLTHPDGPYNPEEEGQPPPTFVDFDNTNHTTWVDPSQGGDIYFTSEFWRYTRSARTLELPNGWVATYETTADMTTKMLVEVHDRFGNSVTPHWSDPQQNYYGPRKLISIDQTVGGNTRTVALNYNGSFVTGISFLGGVAGGGDRTWTFDWGPSGLSVINLPSGPGWHFDYVGPSMSVTTPAGGTVTYDFEWQMFTPDDYGAYVVRHRTTGGREIAAATWNFSYNDRNGIDSSSHVDFPDGRHLDVTNRGLTGTYVDQRWVMMSKVLRSDSEGELSRVELSHADLGFVSSYLRKVTSARTITQGGKQFTTTYAFHDISDHWADYHEPYQVVETGDLTRTTTRAFTYAFNPYKHGVVASQSVTVSGDTMSTSANYDSTTGFMTSQTVAGVTVTFAPDARGNRASVADALSHTTTATYDWGVAATTQTPLYTISRTINPDGTLASEMRNGHTTTFTYDAAGQQTVVTPPAGGATSRLYPNVLADWVQWWRGNEHGVTYFDGYGRTNHVYSEPGIHTSSTFDAQGRKVYQSYPYTDTNIGDTFAYDGLNRVTTITHPDSTSIHYTYSGTDVTITDENGHATTQHWVAFGSPSDVRLASVTDAAGNTWGYEYNGFGSLTRADAPIGPDRTWTYDSHNWLVSETQPESGTTTYGHDAIGRMTGKTDARGNSFAYTYDANNRLTFVDAGETYDQTIAYNDLDQRTSFTSITATQLADYDAAGRQTYSAVLTAGRWFYTYFWYDSNDRLTRIQYPSGRTVDYSYDSSGRVISVTGPNDVVYADQISYHSSGGVASMQLGNGQPRTMAYDTRYRPTHLTDGPLDVGYAYDGVGNVTSVTDARGGHSSSYGYDTLDRLTTISGFENAAFTYDALGNRLTRNASTFTYDVNTLRLTSATGGGPEAGSYGYDATGSQTTDPSGTYSYNPFNMLSQAAVAGQTYYYFYDGDGNRVTRSTPGDAVLQWTIHSANGQLLSEFDWANQAVTWIRDSVYLGSTLIATVHPNGGNVDVEYAHTDALGSVRATTNQSAAVLARHDYFAFGEDAGPGPAMGPERQRFTGQERDSETFFDYMGARYYRNVIGRFTSVDPFMSPMALTNPQKWNRYAYALNNPLRLIDPTGMDPEDPGGDERLSPTSYGDIESPSGELDDFVNSYYSEHGIEHFICANGFPDVQWRDGMSSGGGSQGRPPVYLPIWLDPRFIEASGKAWQRAANGFANDEATFLMVKNDVGIFFPPGPTTNQYMSSTVSRIAGTFGVVHTHPNAAALPRRGDGDSVRATLYNLPIFVLTNRGLYLHMPGGADPVLLRPDLTWLPPKK